MATKCSLMIAATSGFSYDSRSITWHQWHHTAPISSRIGLFSRFAVSNASGPHSCQWIGWCMAERREEEDALASELRGSVLIQIVYRGFAGSVWIVIAAWRAKPICGFVHFRSGI